MPKNKDKDKDKHKDKKKAGEDVVDLASRIGGRIPDLPASPPPPKQPIDALPPRLDGPLPPRRATEQPSESRPFAINPKDFSLEDDEGIEKTRPIPSPRTPPGPSETDVVITPLPTLDDWHRFELALRKVRGVGQVKTEYYRHGVLKARVTYDGEDRLSHALRAGIPGYRVRIIGEAAATLQILVSSESDERRPG